MEGEMEREGGNGLGLSTRNVAASTPTHPPSPMATIRHAGCLNTVSSLGGVAVGAGVCGPSRLQVPRAKCWWGQSGTVLDAKAFPDVHQIAPSPSSTLWVCVATI